MLWRNLILVGYSVKVVLQSTLKRIDPVTFLLSYRVSHYGYNTRFFGSAKRNDIYGVRNRTVSARL